MTDASALLKGITPKKREQLHISGVNMLSECGKRFEFRYILGIRRPPAAFMHIGTAVDASVSRDLQNKIETGELLKRDDAIEIAAETFKARQEADPIELDVDEKSEGKPINLVLGEAQDKTVALAGLHYDAAAPIIHATKVQRKFSIDMDRWLRQHAKSLHAAGDAEQNKFAASILHSEARALNAAARHGLDCAGEQDVVEEIIPDPHEYRPTLHIRDTKTSGKSPTKSLMDGNKQPGIADDSDQLTTYAMASLVLDGKLPDAMFLDYLVYTPARHDTKYVPTKTVRDMNDINVFLNRFANAVHAYKRGIFVPAKADWWGCSQKYCGYWDMCPYAKRPKLIQIQKPLGAQAENKQGEQNVTAGASVNQVGT